MPTGTISASLRAEQQRSHDALVIFLRAPGRLSLLIGQRFPVPSITHSTPLFGERFAGCVRLGAALGVAWMPTNTMRFFLHSMPSIFPVALRLSKNPLSHRAGPGRPFGSIFLSPRNGHSIGGKHEVDVYGLLAQEAARK